MKSTLIALALAGLLALAAGCAPRPTASTPAPAAPSEEKAAPQAALSPLTAASPMAAPGELKLTLLHTNDTWGYLEPCG